MKAVGIIVLFLILNCGTLPSSAITPQNIELFRIKATKSLSHFTPSQELINSITRGTQIAMDQCKEAFIWDRWNCPESAFSKRYNHPFTKETAYVQAITAAGVVYAITQSCSKGEISGCGCDRERSSPLNATLAYSALKKIEESKEVDWIWGGCSDNTIFAEKIAKHMFKTFQEGNDVQAHTMVHNNYVGIKIVYDTLEKQCRCHGMSGSCSLQTCSMRLTTFSEVASALKQRYRNAKQIRFENSPYDVTMGRSAKISVEKIQKTNSNTLLYLEDSPNYCNANAVAGWPGTKDRVCSKSSPNSDVIERKNCKRICRACGYKVRKQIMEVSYKCNCKFLYCCEVKCNTCTKTVETYYCG